MNNLEVILEHYGEEHTFLFPTGFEDAVIGLDEESMRLILSKSKIIKILVEESDMDIEDAIEHYYYNIFGTKGKMDGLEQPIYCDDFYA